jgi:uncharacterized protein
MMKIAICGISGYVGNALKRFFEERGDEVLPVKFRSGTDVAQIAKQMEGCDALINLAGASIMGRWTKAYKEILRSSRLETTGALIEAIALCQHPPRTLLNASAVGIYDSYHQHDEHSRHYGEDFLADLVREWEAAAFRAQSGTLRVCAMRFGVV